MPRAFTERDSASEADTLADEALDERALHAKWVESVHEQRRLEVELHRQTRTAVPSYDDWRCLTIGGRRWLPSLGQNSS